MPKTSLVVRDITINLSLPPEAAGLLVTALLEAHCQRSKPSENEVASHVEQSMREHGVDVWDLLCRGETIMSILGAAASLAQLGGSN
ncbi:hypothetical protein ASD21_15570 [Caulobacter sp. Root1455]|uniref:hypothetical protein n=1 Tax=Caulobacter sp. Root1455 TaxID=1736465 RepID=UPI00070113E7|nr:hypothetical protein [Caulobacter sp. Root1455]KQY92787.1 hypothetical protein ASD21_15570 [Caulobacter sp. Root1455]